MKVSLAISDLSVRGGTHKQLLRLAQYLVNSGDEVEILTHEYVPENCYPEFQDFDVKVSAPVGRGLTKLGGSVEWMLRGYRLAGLLDPRTEVLNIHDLNCEWMGLAVTVLHRKVPLVWQINDMHPAFRLGSSRELAPHWMHPIYRAITKLIARHAKAITVNVTKNAERVTGALGIKPHVYYCGVDRLRSEPLSRALRPCVVLVSIGVMLRYRNYESILDAMVDLREKGVDTRLTIVGSTKFEPAYACEIREKARAEKLEVEITGEVDHGTLQSILEAANIFVFVNVDQSWGLAVFEAMTASLPVVLSNSVGAVELLKESRGVQIVDPKSPQAISMAIQRIIRDQPTYDSISLDAFNDASEYSWDAMYSKKMRDLFAEVALESGSVRNSV
jgi:glycosyltransferase involved in cell wall biosynthesis